MNYADATITRQDPCGTCKGCPSTRPAAMPRGPASRIAVVVDHPSYADTVRGTFLSDDGGKVAKMTLKGHGIDVDDVYVTTALNCRPKMEKDVVKYKAMTACRERLVYELRDVNVEKVLCLGPVGFSALTGAQRVLPITKVRGRWHHAYGMNVLPTFDPKMVMGTFDFFRDFERDVEKFAGTEGRLPNPAVNVWVPESLNEMREAFEFLSGATFVSVDIETTGFSSREDDVLAVGLGVLHEDDSATTVVLDEALSQKRATWRKIASLLSSDRTVVFHNCKFDLKFLKSNLVTRGLDFTPAHVVDTMLLNFALDERPMGKFRSHSLKNISRVRYDAPDYDIEMGRWLKQWDAAHELERRGMRHTMHGYLALDCYYTAMLYPDLMFEVQEESTDLVKFYEKVLMPGTLAFVDIEDHGILIDRSFFNEAKRDLGEQSEDLLTDIRAVVGRDDFNPNSPKQVSEYVYKELALPFGQAEEQMFNAAKETRRGTNTQKKVYHTARRGKQQEGPTAKSVLKALARRYPENRGILEMIVQYRNLTKNAGTYVVGILSRADADDRVRGDFNMHGTATGRISSSNPNLQNIPDSSHTGIEVRNGFIAPEGCLLIEADFSQLELRVAAHLSQDEDFKNVFVEGRDVHQEVTWSLFRKTRQEATKYERYMAKCMNFGVMYQRGAGSLANGPEMDYIEDSGGIRWSQAEVKAFFDKMLSAWPRFKEWMEEQKNIGYTDQYVQLPMGNRRRFPFVPPNDGGAIGRQCVNTPIQGTAGQLTVLALTRIHARLPDGAYIVSTVHDSILIECPVDLVDTVLDLVREEMEDGSVLGTDVPLKSDANVAARWGQMEKWEWDSDTQVLLQIEATD